MHTQRSNEGGSARLKFLIVVAIIGIVGYAAYLYIPIRYEAYLFQDLMQHDADVAGAQGYPPTWVSDQLTKQGPEYGVPADAVITVSQDDNRIQVSVQFTRDIEFPGYTYQYEFDHTAKSTNFFAAK
jgi:hypothetical protein